MWQSNSRMFANTKFVSMEIPLSIMRFDFSSAICDPIRKRRILQKTLSPFLCIRHLTTCFLMLLETYRGIIKFTGINNRQAKYLFHLMEDVSCVYWVGKKVVMKIYDGAPITPRKTGGLQALIKENILNLSFFTVWVIVQFTYTAVCV